MRVSVAEKYETMTNQTYSVAVVPPDLRREETIKQVGLGAATHRQHKRGTYGMGIADT